MLNETIARRKSVSSHSSFPAGSTQIALLGMENANDLTIWHYAKDNDFVIVTTDADFYEISSVYGQPPKIIWLKIGNQSKAATINALIVNQQIIELALIGEGKACIEIYR